MRSALNSFFALILLTSVACGCRPKQPAAVPVPAKTAGESAEFANGAGDSSAGVFNTPEAIVNTVDKPLVEDDATASRTEPAAPAAARVHVVTPTDFFAEYQRDKNSLNDNYKDDVIEISGEAILVGSAHDLPFVRLGVGIDELTGVHCFTRIQQPWAVIVPGQQVKLRGKLPARLFGAQLQDCEIVAAGPSPAIKTSAESLSAELRADPNATNAKYQDVYCFVDGTVDSFDDEFAIALYLKGNGDVRIRCVADEKQLATLKIGDRVHVVGQYPHFGDDGEVNLQNCWFFDPQQIKPVPPLTTGASNEASEPVESVDVPATGEFSQVPTQFVPQDAVAAVVFHPQRAAASEIGTALLALDIIQARLERSQIKPDEIERILYAVGIPTEESESDCTVVQFARSMQRETLLRQEFGDLPYEEVPFQSATYYRYSRDFGPDSSDNRPAAASQPIAHSVATDTTPVMAKFPDDFQPDANGHPDSSGSGKWFYDASETQNPTSPEANLRQLNWDTGRKRYEWPVRGKNNTFPSIDERMHPSPDPPHFAVLRWQSGNSANIRVQGNFGKLADAKESNGVRVLVFVDGERKFDEDVGPRDARGVDFDFTASVKSDSVVDFVVDPKGDAYWDSTKLIATIERSGGNATGNSELVDGPGEPADRNDDAAPMFGSVIYFPDDKTIVTTDEQRLRGLIAGPPVQTPLMKKLAQLDLQHDAVAVIALESCRDQIAGLLTELAEQTESSELKGLSDLPQHAQFAVATLDFSGDTLLRVVVDATDALAAENVESGFDEFIDATEGLRNVLPENSPLLSLVKQLVRGTTLQTNGLQVVLTTKMPAGLLDFVSRDAEAAMAGLPRPARPSVERSKLPMPDQAARDKALQVVRELYESEFKSATTAAEKTALAETMIARARQVESAAERYVLLDVARKMAAGVGGVDVALEATAQLDEFDVDARSSETEQVPAEPKLVPLTDIPMLRVEGVLINDDKGHFREERLKGEKYPQVLWAHPQDKMPSHYAFTLNRKYSQLTGKAAINDIQSVARAQNPQIFAIYGDNRPLWKSRPLQDKLDSQEFSINVSTVKTLHFYVAGGGYGGHALWVDVMLEEKQ